MKVSSRNSPDVPFGFKVLSRTRGGRKRWAQLLWLLLFVAATIGNTGCTNDLKNDDFRIGPSRGPGHRGRNRGWRRGGWHGRPYSRSS